MTRQKNKLLTFIFSLVPGCGQMYLGFMRRGLSFALCFWGSLVAMTAFRIWFFVIPMIIAWFCAFFDAINLNTMPPEHFAERADSFLTPDGTKNEMMPRRMAKWAGIALMATGLYMIWDRVWSVLQHITWELGREFYPVVYYLYDAVPIILISVIVIILGIKLIAGKKKALEEPAEPPINH